MTNEWGAWRERGRLEDKGIVGGGEREGEEEERGDAAGGGGRTGRGERRGEVGRVGDGRWEAQPRAEGRSAVSSR